MSTATDLIPAQDAVPAPRPAAPPIAPPSSRDALWFAPVFVLAPARSYSSVVTTMIGQHPGIYGFPELSLLRTLKVGPLLTDPPNWRGIPALVKQSGLLRALAQVHQGEQTSESSAAALAWLRRRPEWDTLDVFDHLLRQVQPLVGLEKSPETVSHSSYLERLAVTYPRARFLHLVRHPVPSVLSMAKAWQGAGFWDISPELWVQFCLGVWFHQHRRILEFTARFPPDRTMRIRAEDALNAPRRTLPAVCRWLGLDASPSVITAMSHPESDPFARRGPIGAIGGNDPGFLRAPERRRAKVPRSFEFPPGTVLDPWTVLAARELAVQLGYGP